MPEVDLYAPLRDYLVAQGYEVQAEVKGCDVVARKGDALIVIELKQQFGVRLLIQAIDRQRISDSVYVGLPGPYKRGRSRHWREIGRLLRHLELGLIVIDPHTEPPQVEIIFHPLPYQPQKRKRRQRAVLQEIRGRSGDYNQGGSTSGKAITAYRESAIHIACCLEILGASTPSRLRTLGTGHKTQSILSSNFYGWFRRVVRGTYELTPDGRTALETFLGPAARYRQQIQDVLQAETVEQEPGTSG